MAAKKITIDNASVKFKKQSQKREKKIIRCSILVVCEGTKTEPNYFEAFAEIKQGVVVYDIEVKGLGRGTIDVVEKAIRLKNKNNYDRVWAVFDKDDFPAKDFNKAIEMAQNNALITLNNKSKSKMDIVKELQNVMKLEKLPRKIECFDISNISGEFMVAGMCVLKDGEIKKKMDLYK